MITLEAKKREAKPQILRKEGNVPAVVYGNKIEPTQISLCSKELEKTYENAGYFNKVMKLNIDKKQEDVLPKDVQKDPVTGKITHADFMRVKKESKIRVFVPIKFANEEKSTALKRGGMLNIVKHSLEVKCSPYEIPEALICNLSGVKMHDTMTLDQLNLPENITPVHPKRDRTIASIVVSSNTEDASKTEESEEES